MTQAVYLAMAIVLLAFVVAGVRSFLKDGPVDLMIDAIGLIIVLGMSAMACVFIAIAFGVISP